ncbi:MAG TPA: hypothetical protein VGO67_20690 [Verrucomicrobiae bacterium]|jgi:hypothetical protein
MDTGSTHPEKPLADINERVCAKCLYVGSDDHSVEKHEMAAEFLLGLLGPFSSFYSAWILTKPRKCPACGEISFIPVNTRRGLKLVELTKESFGDRCKRLAPVAIALVIMIAIVWISLRQTSHR